MVFLYGWGGFGKYWEIIVEEFFEEFDCLIYDLRGFGCIFLFKFKF